VADYRTPLPRRGPLYYNKALARMADLSSSVRGASCVVTGGAGFIGSHLTDALAAAGARRIVVIDNLQSGRWEHIGAAAERITADLAALTPADLDRLLGGADFLFHLAAEKHNSSKHDPQRVIEVNVQATLRLFAAAAAARLRGVIFTSSLYADGRVTLPPMREDDIPEPRTVYGISKLAGEHLLRHFDLPAVAFRLFFTYGPRQFAGSGYKSVIVSNFERILRGEQPLIRGDGRQALDYIHVDDVVRALLLGTTGAANGEVVNIGSGAAVTICDLTAAMLDVAGSSLQPAHAPADWTAGTHRVCDNGKARRLLGWSPAVSLPAGLAGVHVWMKSQS